MVRFVSPRVRQQQQQQIFRPWQPGSVKGRLLKGLATTMVGAMASWITFQLEVINPGVIENIEARDDDLFLFVHFIPATIGAALGLITYIVVAAASKLVLTKKPDVAAPAEPEPKGTVAESPKPPRSFSHKPSLRKASDRFKPVRPKEPIGPPSSPPPSPPPVSGDGKTAPSTPQGKGVSHDSDATPQLPFVEKPSDTLPTDPPTPVAAPTQSNIVDVVLAKDLQDQKTALTLLQDGIDYARIGEFAIIGKLGEGGFGKVYLGVKKSRVAGSTFEVKAAIKVMKADQYIDRYLDEIRALVALDHPSIIRFLDCGENANASEIYVFTEFVDGSTISAGIKKALQPDMRKHLKAVQQGKANVFPVAEAVDLIVQAAEALEYAWTKHSLIHRDIKADNLMIAQGTGKAKLLDFGLARKMGDDGRTLPGSVIGSPKYMSPERVDVYLNPGNPVVVDFRSDIYALGVTLYCMLSGRFPINGKGMAEIFKNQREVTPPDIRKYNPRIPEGLAKLINDKMLAKSPDDRFSSYAELIQALKKFR